MDLTEFEDWLGKNNLRGYWQRARETARTQVRSKVPGPRVPIKPHLWEWSTTSEALRQAGELIGAEDSFRRSLSYSHPDRPAGTGVCSTFSTGTHIVKPGEHELAHRHAFGAMRFIIDGDGTTYTNVNGEAFPMESGDLITTPSQTWHDHLNQGEKPVIWLDILDTHTVSFIGLMEGEILFDAQGKYVQDVEHSDGAPTTWGPSIRPDWIQHGAQPPAIRYSWRETERLLDLLAGREGDPFDGISIRYLDPITGGPTLPTVSCEMLMLKPGGTTQSHRHSSTVFYHVFEGTGSTVMNGDTFEWKTGDGFVVPAWCTHHHQNATRENVYLFTTSDRPIVEALGLYREEAV